MLELIDRPAAYEDVGRLCRWGSVIHELKNYESELRLLEPSRIWKRESIDEFITAREKARQLHLAEMATVSAREPRARSLAIERNSKRGKVSLLDETPASSQPAARSKAALSRRRADTPGKLVPPRANEYVDRRAKALLAPAKKKKEQRKSTDRRRKQQSVPFPDRRLTRSAYEQVFLRLVSGRRLRLGGSLYTPVGMQGWYHAIFRRESDGAERLLTIDQLLRKMKDWV
jgi:hypothetical protein